MGKSYIAVANDESIFDLEDNLVERDGIQLLQKTLQTSLRLLAGKPDHKHKHQIVLYKNQQLISDLCADDVAAVAGRVHSHAPKVVVFFLTDKNKLNIINTLKHQAYDDFVSYVIVADVADSDNLDSFLSQDNNACIPNVGVFIYEVSDQQVLKSDDFLEFVMGISDEGVLLKKLNACQLAIDELTLALLALPQEKTVSVNSPMKRIRDKFSLYSADLYEEQQYLGRQKMKQSFQQEQDELTKDLTEIRNYIDTVDSLQIKHDLMTKFKNVLLVIANLFAALTLVLAPIAGYNFYRNYKFHHNNPFMFYPSNQAEKLAEVMDDFDRELNEVSLALS